MLIYCVDRQKKISDDAENNTFVTTVDSNNKMNCDKIELETMVHSRADITVVLTTGDEKQPAKLITVFEQSSDEFAVVITRTFSDTLRREHFLEFLFMLLVICWLVKHVRCDIFLCRTCRRACSGLRQIRQSQQDPLSSHQVSHSVSFSLLSTSGWLDCLVLCLLCRVFFCSTWPNNFAI